MAEARARLLARLRAAPPKAAPELPDWQPPRFGAERLDRFRRLLEAAHAEVYEVAPAAWPQRLRTLLANRGVRSLLYAPDTEAGRQLAEAWNGDGQAPRLIAYDRPVEEIKDRLVHEADAALTMTAGGIAETGTLILWPTAEEPRLMSLLPPIHVALVKAERIGDTLAEVMRSQGWSARMPTNLVLVSGPSKTADIKQTLAYGVHGPRELIVFILKPEARQ